MARIRLLSWNIEVWGPKKYTNSVNKDRLAKFVAEVTDNVGADILVVMELMESVSTQIGVTLKDELEIVTGGDWNHYIVHCRDADQERESYGIFWRVDNVQFEMTSRPWGDGTERNIVLSDQGFPCRLSPKTGGRQAAIATFITNDVVPDRYFAVSVLHSVPDQALAPLALDALAKTPALYFVDDHNRVNQQGVDYRILAGDYNLDVNNNYFNYLIAAVPEQPPPVTNNDPNQNDEGAGTAPILPTNIPANFTHLYSWDRPPAPLPPVTAGYRDMQLDNIFYSSANPPLAASGVIDVLQLILNPGPLRNLANRFRRYNGTLPAFPHAQDIPQPIANADAAWAFCRYAISDHLPVFVDVTL
jgi:hypothetical protein